MQTQTTPAFLDPATVEFRAAGFGYESGTAIVWRTAQWAGPGDPSSVHHGVRLIAYLDGESVLDGPAVEDATDAGDPAVQAAVGRLRLDLVALHGRRPLDALQAEITAIGVPEHLISQDEQLVDVFRRRVAKDGPSDADRAVLAQVDAAEKQLTALRRRYATGLWRYVAHLWRHGMDAAAIARWTGVDAAVIERRVTSVTTAGAAAVLGVEPKTWSSYVARGQAPAPDDQVGREPVWHLDTVLAHQDARPGTPGRPKHT